MGVGRVGKHAARTETVLDGGRRMAVAVALSLIVSACVHGPIGPPLDPVTAATPAAWSEPIAVEPVTDLARYWQALDDPLLTQFVEQAVARNLDLAQSAARLAQAREALMIARAGYIPQVSATGGLQRDVGDFTDDRLRFSVGANAAWEADLFGRIEYSVEASRQDLAGAGYALADLQRLIVGQVALSTISARSTAAQLAIARQTLRVQDDNLQIARWRNQAGLVSSLDVEQARSQRAQVAATIPALESSLAATANGISTLIGEPPGRVRALLQDAANLPEPPSLSGIAAPADVLRRRPDVRAAETALLSDGARIGVARADLFPTLQITGNIGAGSFGIGSLFDTITGNLFAGITQLLFDGGRTRAQIRLAEAVANGSLAAYRLSILGALEDVESAIAARRAADARTIAFGEALDAADNAAILARSQYQAGLTDFQTLLTAENQLLSARNALVSAEADRAISFVRLTQALGGGWTDDPDPAPPTDRTLP